MPRLVIRAGEGTGRDHAVLSPCVVGRDPGAAFVLDDPLVSRQHLRVVNAGGQWQVEDLGSRNGTRLNGTRVARAPLHDGDRLGLGSTELEFVQKDLLRGPAPPGARPAAPASGRGRRRGAAAARPPARQRPGPGRAQAVHEPCTSPARAGVARPEGGGGQPTRTVGPNPARRLPWRATADRTSSPSTGC
ncbi:MAG: FHA domain-containing protein [Planctomycetia bacterium]